MLQELVSLVDRLKKRIQDYQKELQSSEALTRYVLIDPLLRALGWDTENPELVRPEVSTQAGRPDYALLHGGQRLAFIGAKALGKHEEYLQQISYCVSEAEETNMERLSHEYRKNQVTHCDTRKSFFQMENPIHWGPGKTS
ncbi:MAG: hypothetical protein NYU39_01705 [Aigarchaeota archaeon]|nr:hypothetical protein [Candidatus Caldarchaeales archaeon]MDJ0273488.1 hypothetical protein [Candidatus Caldarchaeales archaeon]